MAAPIAVNGATIEPGPPVALFHTRIYGGGTDLNVGTNYDIARDGRFLINTVLDDAASPITLLKTGIPRRRSSHRQDKSSYVAKYRATPPGASGRQIAVRQDLTCPARP